MHQTQAGTACIQTHILYDVVGRKCFFCCCSYLYYGLGCEKGPLASMSQLTGSVGSLWDGWKLWGHSLREPHAAQEGLFHFASPAGSNKTAPRHSFITRSNVDASPWPLIPSGKKTQYCPSPVVWDTVKSPGKHSNGFEKKKKKETCKLAGPPFKLTWNQHL